jgi:ubiquinone/menaquinone biosynthesis C-methylase UbiE
VNANKALWEKGDFTEIAQFMRESGEELAGSVGVAAGARVLDLGCGDGTTALPFARLGADVTGIDIAENLVEAGNRRAAEAGLDNVTFEQGDATDLRGVDDDSFDLTFSCFGAMFAPKPFDVAKEMVRVTKKPGGRIVMANWIPNDDTSFVSQLLKISAAFSPPPPEGFISPVTWGVESHVVERFGAAGVAEDQIEMVKDRFVFRSADVTTADYIDAFRRFYGPTMNAFEAAEANGNEDELRGQLVKLADEHNTNANGAGFNITATYLRVTVSL